MLPASWNAHSSYSYSSQLDENDLEGKYETEGGEGLVELDEDIDLPRPPEPPPPFPPNQPSTEPEPSFFSGLLGTLSEAWKLTSDIHTEVDLTIIITITNTITIIITITQGGVINIKPLVNLTINKLGLLDGADDESVSPADNPANVLKSMFRIWNPEVGWKRLDWLIYV